MTYEVCLYAPALILLENQQHLQVESSSCQHSSGIGCVCCESLALPREELPWAACQLLRHVLNMQSLKGVSRAGSVIYLILFILFCLSYLSYLYNILKNDAKWCKHVQHRRIWHVKCILWRNVRNTFRKKLVYDRRKCNFNADIDNICLRTMWSFLGIHTPNHTKPRFGSQQRRHLQSTTSRHDPTMPNPHMAAPDQQHKSVRMLKVGSFGQT